MGLWIKEKIYKWILFFYFLRMMEGRSIIHTFGWCWIHIIYSLFDLMLVNIFMKNKWVPMILHQEVVGSHLPNLSSQVLLDGYWMILTYVYVLSSIGSFLRLYHDRDFLISYIWLRMVWLRLITFLWTFVWWLTFDFVLGN